MDLVSYLHSKVYITLSNGFYYEGIVLSADEGSLTLKDKTGRRVSLTKDSISTIREVKDGN